jgi:hypothetical protein
MAHKKKSKSKTPAKPKAKPVVAVPAAPAVQPPSAVDELAGALRGLVTVAEANGQRDHPAVVQAHELLAKHGKL